MVLLGTGPINLHPSAVFSSQRLVSRQPRSLATLQYSRLGLQSRTIELPGSSWPAAALRATAGRTGATEEPHMGSPSCATAYGTYLRTAGATTG
jgi:hypothetical protein